MNLRIWGCRGSLPAPGPETARYGGETSCVEVRLADGSVVVLDAGSGIRRLGESLMAEGVGVVHVLLTHLHLDHIQGLPFFAPLRSAEAEVHLWGPPDDVPLARRLAAYLSPPLFPVTLDEFPATVHLHHIPAGTWELGPAMVRAEFVLHQGPTMGFRLEESGAVSAYIPDHEPAMESDLHARRPAAPSGLGLAKNADVLLHDGQFRAAEYAARRGWGHSSVSDALAFAALADVGQLVVFHHDPGRTDDALEAVLDEAVSQTRLRPEDVILARQGDVLVPGRPVAAVTVR